MVYFIALSALLVIGLIPWHAMSMSGTKKGGRGARSYKQQRAFSKQFVLSGTDANFPSQGSFWVPADGILSRVELDLKVTLTSPAGMTALAFSFFTHPQFTAVTGVILPDDIDATTDFVNMSNTFLMMLPLSDVETEQACSSNMDLVMRLNVGDTVRYQLTEFDDALTATWELMVTFHLMVSTPLQKFQETFPFQIFLLQETGVLKWKPPAPGLFYNVSLLLWDQDFDGILNLSFNTPNTNTLITEEWKETTRDRQIHDIRVSIDEEANMFTTHYIPQFFANEFTIRKGEAADGGGNAQVMITGFYAPKPGAKFSYEIRGADDDAEVAVPFFAVLKEMDISAAWGVCGLGDTVLKIYHVPFEEIGDQGEGSLFESGDLLFKVFSHAAAGSERWQESFNTYLKPRDMIIVSPDDQVDVFSVLCSGYIPKHRYGLRPCSTYITGEYVLEGFMPR